MKVTWTEPSLVGLEAIYEFLSPMNPAAAQRVAEENPPRRGQPLTLSVSRPKRPGANTRELLIVRPYVIIYRIVGDDVLILRTWHSAQEHLA